MGNAEQTLVIILASFLALFLLLAIIIAVKVIQVLNHLKNISEKAEKLASTAGNIGDFFKYTAGPAALAKLIANVTDVFNHKKSKSKE